MKGQKNTARAKTRAAENEKEYQPSPTRLITVTSSGMVTPLSRVVTMTA